MRTLGMWLMVIAFSLSGAMTGHLWATVVMRHA